MAIRGGYVVLDLYPSSSSSKHYEVRRGGDGVLYCMCMGWKMNKLSPKRCKHTEDYVRTHPGTRYYLGKGGLEPVTMPDANAPVVKKVASKPVAVPDTVPAGANWREMLMAEKADAARRGVSTPREALSAYAKELELDE